MPGLRPRPDPVLLLATLAAPAGPASPLRSRRWHQPLLAKLRRRGQSEAAFHGDRTAIWFRAGVAAILVLALWPFLAPQWSAAAERLATLASLVFLIAAIGLLLRLGPRSFAVATALVALLYAATSWTAFAYDLSDFFVAAVVGSFLVFALAGFNLVFVLEEVVYDAHVRLHVRHRAWEAVPTMAVLTLAVALPVWDRNGGPSLPAVWVASLVAATALTGWWFLAVVNRIDGRNVLRELHLLVVGALLASLAADGVALLHRLPLLVPSLVAYLLLIGTWVYVTYTTLQRTQFLVRGADAAPWIAILLGASLAIIAHAQILFQQRGAEAVADLADARLRYLAIGIWAGIGFLVVRSLGRILRHLRDTQGLGDASRAFAGQAVRVTDTLATTERYIEVAADRVLRGVDRVLPGRSAPPRPPPGWELDGGRLKRLE